MNKNLIIACVAVVFLIVSFTSCKKDGLNSAEAKKIQYRWERISGSSATDYLDGGAVIWSVTTDTPGTYLQFGSDGYFSDIYSVGSTKYQYMVDGNRILSIVAGSSWATTPQYTDTTLINYVDDHLLVLSHKKYFSSPAYNFVDKFIDSLKK